MKVITALGTRPEIIKLSPVLPLFDLCFEHKLIHTGQHYDYNMDEIFFKDLNLREPDYALGIGSGTHAYQTGKMLIEIEEILLKERPKVVVVLADPNTPLAAALAAVKLNITLVHVEAGCRSFNRSMPEEMNRIVIDHCSDILIAPDQIAYDNLLLEGISEEKIFLLGSTGVEACFRNRELAEKSLVLSELNLEPQGYVLATIHRSENTDDRNRLADMLEALSRISERRRVVFPMHPRTMKSIADHKLSLSDAVNVISPVGYLDFLKLIGSAQLVLSDSGGIQEEAAVFNVPCLVMRNETEWEYLIKAKKNLLVGTSAESIYSAASALLDNPDALVAIKARTVQFKADVSKDIVEVISREAQR